ncbi:hypothetical protein GQX74_013155 [Glossina fuscipes]|nr:hypothetical protein GQX74_013155 [Glossina fuscipes]
MVAPVAEVLQKTNVSGIAAILSSILPKIGVVIVLQSFRCSDLEVILGEDTATLVEFLISLMLEWLTLPLFACSTIEITGIRLKHRPVTNFKAFRGPEQEINTDFVKILQRDTKENTTVLSLRIDESSAAMQKKNGNATTYDFNSVLLSLSAQALIMQSLRGIFEVLCRHLYLRFGESILSHELRDEELDKLEFSKFSIRYASEIEKVLEYMTVPCRLYRLNLISSPSTPHDGMVAVRSVMFIINELLKIIPTYTALCSKSFITSIRRLRQTHTSLASHLKMPEGDSTHCHVIYKKYPNSFNNIARQGNI